MSVMQLPEKHDHQLSGGVSGEQWWALYLTLSETRVIGLHFAADNMQPIIITQLSLKVELSKSVTADTKTEFDVK